MKEQYYGEYFARAVMFTDEIEQFLKKFEQAVLKLNINMAELLEVMNETFLNYAENGYVTDKVKGNIYLFIHYMNRLHMDTDTYQVHKLYHQEIIDMLNGDSRDAKIFDFYRHEIFVRKNKKSCLNQSLVSNQVIEKMIPSINASIVFDSDILLSHLDESEEEFSKHSIHYVSSPYYVESARYLMYEYPGLMGEPNFKNRLCSTLERRLEFSKQYRRNIFKRFALDKENKHIGTITYRRDNKKLYKQVIGQ